MLIHIALNTVRSGRRADGPNPGIAAGYPASQILYTVGHGLCRIGVNDLDFHRSPSS